MSPWHRTPKARLQHNAFEVWVAFAAILTSVSFLLAPEAARQTPIGIALARFAWTWTYGYGIAGVLLLFGLWRGKANVEVAGLCLLSAALLMNALAGIALAWPAAFVSTIVYLSCACASVTRVVVISQHSRQLSQDEE